MATNTLTPAYTFQSVVSADSYTDTYEVFDGATGESLDLVVRVAAGCSQQEVVDTFERGDFYAK